MIEITCNNCGAKLSTEPPEDSAQLSVIPESMTAPAYYDFCDWACLREFAAEQNIHQKAETGKADAKG